jgi:hypothetical protein
MLFLFGENGYVGVDKGMESLSLRQSQGSELNKKLMISFFSDAGVTTLHAYCGASKGIFGRMTSKNKVE